MPIEKLAARGPAAVGEKRNVKVQNAPAASPGAVGGQSVCPWKSPLPIAKALAGAAPLNVASTSGPGPLFVIVTACEPMLVVPTRCFANAAADEDSTANGVDVGDTVIITGAEVVVPPRLSIAFAVSA